jgi:uncharacterized phosphatase
LSESGSSQVRLCADHLAQTQLDAVYSSTLLRAVQTAECIASPKGLKPVLDPRLVEIDFGRWEGLRRAEIQAAYGENWCRWGEAPESSRAGETGKPPTNSANGYMNSFGKRPNSIRRGKAL